VVTRSKPSEPRPALSRERIVDAAMDLADASGVRTLSMRHIGDRLGVQAMSLYNYITGKDELLSAMIDRVFGQIDLGHDGDNWKASLRATATSAHDLFLEHPWACELVLTPGTLGVPSTRLSYIESILARLRGAGFSPTGASHGYHALDSHTLGFTLWELGHRLPADVPDDVVTDLLAQLDPAHFGYLIEHAGVHFAEPTGDIDEFAFGLDLIIEGLEARLDQRDDIN